MTEVVISGCSVTTDDPSITLPKEEQIRKIINILLSNRLLRLVNQPNWQIVARRRFPPQRSMILNKIDAFFLNLHQFIPIVCAFTHEVECFCFDCDNELNTIGVTVTDTIQGRDKVIQKKEWYPNLVAYCPNCDFTIKLYESIWADDDES